MKGGGSIMDVIRDTTNMCSNLPMPNMPMHQMAMPMPMQQMQQMPMQMAPYQMIPGQMGEISVPGMGQCCINAGNCCINPT
jgi:hypothetical protein